MLYLLHYIISFSNPILIVGVCYRVQSPGYLLVLDSVRSLNRIGDFSNIILINSLLELIYFSVSVIHCTEDQFGQLKRCKGTKQTAVYWYPNLLLLFKINSFFNNPVFFLITQCCSNFDLVCLLFIYVILKPKNILV